MLFIGACPNVMAKFREFTTKHAFIPSDANAFLFDMLSKILDERLLDKDASEVKIQYFFSG